MPPKKTVASAAGGDDAIIAEKYRTHTHKQHVLELPDTYVGSTEPDTVKQWFYRETEDASPLRFDDIRFTMGFYKVFDEVLVNAIDQQSRLRTYASKGQEVPHQVHKIAVNVDAASGTISISNDGMGIDVVEHPEHKIYVPHLIFGRLLSSGNYNKHEEKFTGGKNGYGAKLANIFATEFTVETIDSIREKSFKLTWYENMERHGKPVVRACKRAPVTTITWKPDLPRFGMTTIDDDTIALLHRRTLDAAAWCGRNVAVNQNGKRVECRDLLSQAKLHLTPTAGKPVYVENPRWRIVVAPSSEFRQVSFVNGINTSGGGRHVDTVLKIVTDSIVDYAKAKKKVTLKPQYVRDNMFVFVAAEIVNPSFSSQTKEVLTTPKTKFGSVPEFTTRELERIAKDTGILEAAMRTLEAKEVVDAKKADGTKKSSITVPKLEDAVWAGTRRSAECTLILTEGDSAKTSAISGLRVVGRERQGVFPLRGKFLNVRECSRPVIMKNAEVQNIVKILGLKYGATQTSVDQLRQGRIMALTDQDLDGSHIKGLIMNFINQMWPSLLEIGFVVSMATPILKVMRDRHPTRAFQSAQEYEHWRETMGDDASRWKVKQYKGLGTSTAEEACEWFREPRTQLQKTTPGSDETISLAFDKKLADARKDWLREYDEADVLDFRLPEVTCEDFVHKELKHFSIADNMRSIPSVMDGLKPSQRKILQACFKRNLKSDVKVAQLAGYVSEHSAQHHGEASLISTIVNMAQNQVGSNNINVLEPLGQFGSRILGGKDSAAARYIFTRLEEIARVIQPRVDDNLLRRVEDDGSLVEPVQYEPILPMVLVNGADGIGTGQSTSIPPHNPRDIVANLRRLIEGWRAELPTSEIALAPLMPWFSGFKGEVEALTGSSFITRGKYEVTGDAEVTITELPVGVWTEPQKEFLQKLTEGDASTLWRVENQSTDVDVRFVLKWRSEAAMADSLHDGKAKPGTDVFTTNFKLQKTFTSTNMWLFNGDGVLQKYDTAVDVLVDFAGRRRETYVRRRESILRDIADRILVASNRYRFILAQVENKLDLRRKSDEEVAALMREGGYTWRAAEPSDDVEAAPGLEGWKYLLSMQVRSFTQKRLEELAKEVEELQAERADIEGKTGDDLWLEDLDRFEEAYVALERERNRKRADAPKAAASAKRPVVRRRAARKPKA